MWMKENLNGEEHPRWKGGSVPYSHPFHSVRREVMKRDGCCQKCKSTPESLDAHHIKPVREFDDPSKSHTLDNLVALCRSCHAKLEKMTEEKQRAKLR